MEGINTHVNGAIGIIDSGMGGLSVLADLLLARPKDRYVYYADTDYAPYGSKSREEVEQRVMGIAGKLIDSGIRLLVIACNTATSAASDTVRLNATIPVVGMEPALKPAVANQGPLNILVAATPLTLQEDKFSRLLEQWKGHHHIWLMPCPGLVEVIEEEGPEAPAVDEKLKALAAPYQCSGISRLVLGCTHYVLVRHKWQQLLGDQVEIIDGNQGTVRQVVRLAPSTFSQEGSRVILRSSSRHPDTLPCMKTILVSQLKQRGLTEADIQQHMTLLTEEE